MHSDFASVIGKSHKVNQDYIRVKDNLVVLSDGCSSSPDTDFGARLLTKACEEYEPIVAINQASNIAKQLKLPLNCLDATLIKLKVENNILNGEMYGDGVIALKRKDGKTLVNSINFIDGYPQYLSYNLSISRQEALSNCVGENKKILTTLLLDTNGDVISSDSITEGDHPLSLKFETNILDFAFAFSDGVASFLRANEKDEIENVPINKVIHRLTDIKFQKGEFIQRQMNGFLLKSKFEGWYNIDDFTVGAICLK